MSKLGDGIARRWRFAVAWLRDGKPLWFWFVGAAILLGVPYYLPAMWLGSPVSLANRVRWSGMFLQFAGLVTVVWGLNESRQLFKRPSIWRTVWAWLARIRFIVAPPAPINVALAPQNITLGLAADAVIVEAPDGTLEGRVAILERRLERLQQEHGATNQRLDTLSAKTDQRFDKERGEREAGDKKVSDQIEAATIGGIRLELGGLAYLFIGIAFTSIPSEVACVLASWGL